MFTFPCRTFATVVRASVFLKARDGATFRVTPSLVMFTRPAGAAIILIVPETMDWTPSTDFEIEIIRYFQMMTMCDIAFQNGSTYLPRI